MAKDDILDDRLVHNPKDIELAKYIIKSQI